MTLPQIEDNVKSLINNFTPSNFIYDFLIAYDAPKSAITRLKNGSLNASKNVGELIWKKKIFYKEVFTEELNTIISDILKDERVKKNKVRFLIATDHKNIVAVDLKNYEQIETTIENLIEHVAFFLPLAGMEKYESHTENDADVKAAVQMAKLFDEIKKTNPTDTQEQVHYLNVFLSRLLFCFFAEDTEIFEKNLFTSSINNHTQPDGSDLHTYLQNLFIVLNTEVRPAHTQSYLKAFPYVNGGLFRVEIPLPNFTFKSRKAIIDSGGENWASINPDIFGSMIQAVVTPSQRGNLGMHYTSVPNIMKVIRPLFLDEVYEEFESAKFNANGLNKLLNRIANIRIFDPACGSGNFLIIAYKELRYLEIKILLQLKNLSSNNYTGFEEKQQELFAKKQLSLADAKPQSFQIEMFSRIELNHFYGIELDDFAHEVAKLSLWLAQHQMNLEFNKLIGTSNPSLPLRDAGVIVQDNATRLNWETVCPKPNIGEVFILGNPPYLGARLQDDLKKEDMALVFAGIDGYNNLDYIACWFKKGSNYIINSDSKFAFVSTNSICQGEQVAILWEDILSSQIEIEFAHTSFKWTNNAKSNAAVIVSIIGLRNNSKANKYLYSTSLRKLANNINPYLIDSSNIFINKRTYPLTTFLPEICFGSMPNDGGFLILNKEERDILLDQNINSKKFIKNLIGAQEFIRGEERFCLWISSKDLAEALEINFINQRISSCNAYRLKSKRNETKELSKIPYSFGEVRHKNTHSIIIPRVSSENRDYIPIGYLNSDSVISDAALAVYNAQSFIFSIITSRMHMCWVKTIGGRLKTDYRYSASLCYNTFPIPQITQSQKEVLEQHTHNILKQRAIHTEKTLAELYDTSKMPDGLLQAHKELDIAVEKCYRDKPFETDEERLAFLFKLYEQMIEEEKTKGTLFEAESKPKKSKKK